MNGYNTGYGNITGHAFNSSARHNTGTRKIIGIEFKTGYRYVSGKGNKAG